MKIIFFISSLSCGGAERVVSVLSNHMVKNNNIIVATRYQNDADFYCLDHRIRRVFLLKKLIKTDTPFLVFVSIFATIGSMIKIIKNEKPDIAVSFTNKLNVMSIIACKIAGVPVISSERSNPKKEKIGRLFNFLRKKIYPYADMNIFQTLGARDFFSVKVKQRSQIIKNPLPVNLARLPKNSCRNKTIVAMGRLVYAKRFDRLVEAVAIVQEKLRANGWQVYLYGDGIIKNEIAEKIAGYKLEDIFFLKGRTATPYDVMAESSVFTITSEYEGFPNVLCEAMACGCVPVSVDFDFGPREMITHKVNGLLVGQNPKDVAQGLVWLIDHPAELEGMRQEAFKIYECLCVEKIASQWESVFEQISITP